MSLIVLTVAEVKRTNFFLSLKTLLTKEGPNLPQYGVARKPITNEAGVWAEKKNTKKSEIIFFLISKTRLERNKILIEKFLRSFSETKWVNYFVKHRKSNNERLWYFHNFLTFYKRVLQLFGISSQYLLQFYDEKQIKMLRMLTNIWLCTWDMQGLKQMMEYDLFSNRVFLSGINYLQQFSYSMWATGFSSTWSHGVAEGTALTHTTRVYVCKWVWESV